MPHHIPKHCRFPLRDGKIESQFFGEGGIVGSLFEIVLDERLCKALIQCERNQQRNERSIAVLEGFQKAKWRYKPALKQCLGVTNTYQTHGVTRLLNQS